jgi:hypothetical protein
MLMILSTFYTAGQMWLSYLYAWESPLFMQYTKQQRWTPIILSIISGSIWILQVLFFAVKLLLSKDIWAELEDVVQLYLIVVGIP